MNARLVEYDDNGKPMSAKQVEVYFASNATPPTVVVELGGRGKTKTRHLCVFISPKQLLSLILGRLIESAR
jgi:hypothetical protein